MAEPSAGQDKEIRHHLDRFGRNLKQHSHSGKLLHGFSKTKHTATIEPTNGIHAPENQAFTQTPAYRCS